MLICEAAGYDYILIETARVTIRRASVRNRNGRNAPKAKADYGTIPTDESSIDFTFSEKFIKRMNKLIRAQRKSYYKFINTAAKRAAVIFAAIIIKCSYKCPN
jgi:hypothetical protein